MFYEILFPGSSMVTKIIDGSIKRLTLAPEYLAMFPRINIFNNWNFWIGFWNFEIAQQRYDVAAMHLLHSSHKSAR